MFHSPRSQAENEANLHFSQFFFRPPTKCCFLMTHYYALKKYIANLLQHSSLWILSSCTPCCLKTLFSAKPFIIVPWKSHCAFNTRLSGNKIEPFPLYTAQVVSRTSGIHLFISQTVKRKDKGVLSLRCKKKKTTVSNMIHFYRAHITEFVI